MRVRQFSRVAMGAGVVAAAIVACTGDDPQLPLIVVFDGGPAPTVDSSVVPGTDAQGTDGDVEPPSDAGADADASVVDGGLRISGLSVGYETACVIVASRNHELWCWGSNHTLMLDPLDAGSRCEYADASYDCAPAPRRIAENVSDVALGLGFGCFIKTGRAYCWGSNAFEELGRPDASTTPCKPLGGGNTDCSHAPVAVDIPPSAGAISKVIASPTSHHACALTTASQLWCWGSNFYAQVAGPATSHSARPTRLAGELSIATASVGGQILGRTCATDTEGKLSCWGHLGGLAVRDAGACDGAVCAPVALVDPANGAEDFRGTRSALGDLHGCALVETKLHCWGNNALGQVSPDGNLDASFDVPTVPATGAGHDTNAVAVVSIGVATTCTQGNDGLVCFGDNTFAQLGSFDPSVRKSTKPATHLFAEGGYTTVIVTRNPDRDVVQAYGGNILGLLGHLPWTENDRPVAASNVAPAGSVAEIQFPF